MKVYSLCNSLKNLRENHNLKQNTVAEYLNISQQSYSRYENGKRELPISYLEPLSKLYNVSTDFLLGISMSENDLSALSDFTYNGHSLQNLLDDITSLNSENMSLLVSYIEFLKFMQNK